MQSETGNKSFKPPWFRGVVRDHAREHPDAGMEQIRLPRHHRVPAPGGTPRAREYPEFRRRYLHLGDARHARPQQGRDGRDHQALHPRRPGQGLAV